MRIKNLNNGFTLIELLVVISIISLLSTIVIASISTARANARDAERISNLKQIQAAVELYALDHNGDYPGYLGTENTYTRSEAGASEVSSNGNGCGYGAPGTPGDTVPGYMPGIWCRFETALAQYIKKLPKPPRINNSFYEYVYKIPNSSAFYNPNGIRFYGLGVRLERPNSVSQNDGGYASDMFEIGQLPRYCSAKPNSVGRDWNAWAATPCSCLTSTFYSNPTAPGSDCGL